MRTNVALSRSRTNTTPRPVNRRVVPMKSTSRIEERRVTLRRSTDLGLHRRGTLMCWLLSAAISLSCQGRGAPGGPKGPIGVTSLPESLAASDSTFRCALGLTLELASGDAIRNAKLCVGQRSDTSYALGY